MTLKALLFDVDGTIADTENLGHRPAYNKAFRRLGVSFRWTPRLYRELLGQAGGRERLLHYLHHYRPELGIQASDILCDVAGWVERAHALKTRYFHKALATGQVPLRSGIRRLITEAHANGIKIALVTNASPESLRPLLEYGMAGLACLVDVVVTGADVSQKKPSPDGYLLALQQLQIDPADCVAFEDSAMGLTAATAAGITTIITRNSNTLADDFSSAALVLDAIGEPGSSLEPVRGRLSSGAGHLTLSDVAALVSINDQETVAPSAF